jgi:hypothetical protein
MHVECSQQSQENRKYIGIADGDVFNVFEREDAVKVWQREKLVVLSWNYAMSRDSSMNLASINHIIAHKA